MNTKLLIVIIVGLLLLSFMVNTLAQGPYDGGPVSEITVVNMNDTSATLLARYITEDGTIYTLPNQILDGKGSNYTYYAEPTKVTDFKGPMIIESNNDIGAIVSTHWFSGSHASYNAISQGAKLIVLPLIMVEYYGQNSSVTLQNTDPYQSANVNITYTRQEGGEVVNNSLTIPSSASTTTIPTGIIPTVNGFIGSAIISSTTPLVAVVHTSIGSSSYHAYTGVSQSSLDTVAYLPLIQSGFAGYITSVNVADISGHGHFITISYIGSIQRDNLAISYTCEVTANFGGGYSISFYNNPNIPFAIVYGSSNGGYVSGGDCLTYNDTSFKDAADRLLPDGKFLGSAIVTGQGDIAVLVSNYSGSSFEVYRGFFTNEPSYEVFAPSFQINRANTTSSVIVQNVCNKDVTVSSTFYNNPLISIVPPMLSDINISSGESETFYISPNTGYDGWVGSVKITQISGPANCLIGIVHDISSNNGDSSIYNMVPYQPQKCQYVPFTANVSNSQKRSDIYSNNEQENFKIGTLSTLPCLNPLSITKSGPTQATTQNPIVYRLTIANHHHLSATNIHITDTLPTNTSHLFGGMLLDQDAIWEVDYLAPNESITLTLLITASANITQVITNTHYGVSADGFSTVWNTQPVVTVLSNGQPSHVYVVNENGQPISTTLVYRNGKRMLDINSSIALPDAQGLITTTALYYGEQLTALQPVYEQPTLRQAHNPDGGDNFAYRVYISNMGVDNDGNVEGYSVPGSNQVYTLTIKPENTLILFNIVASVEWDAGADYLADLEEAFWRASDYLYDVTDGQMAFGWVSIYDNEEHWTDADFHFLARSNVIPHGDMGGLHSTDTSLVISIGRFWDGFSSQQGNWYEPYGYRTLIHEFAHYGLHLEDEHFIDQVDNNGNPLGRFPAMCTDVTVKNNTNDNTNASIMFWQYNASELADIADWNENCQNTEQHRIYGKSDWQTILDFYSGSDWVLQTPNSRGKISGPANYPVDILPASQISLHNSGSINGYPRQLTVLDPNSTPVVAGVSLYIPTREFPLGQGLTNQAGQITVYGASTGDIIKVANETHYGQLVVGEEVSYILYLNPVRKTTLTKQAVNQSGYLQLIPGDNGQYVNLEVAGLTPNLTDLTALVSTIGYTTAPSPTPLLYNQNKQIYTGTSTFEGVTLGSGRVLVKSNDLENNLNSNYVIHLINASDDRFLYSEDGNFELHLFPSSLPQGYNFFSSILLTGHVPQPLPANKSLIGEAYHISFSGQVVVLDKEAILKLYYPPEVSGFYTNTAIYRWSAINNLWQKIEGQADSELKDGVVALINKVGIYALMGEPLRSIYLPLILK